MWWLKKWHRGPIAALIVVWLLCSGSLLTLFFISQMRIAERDATEMGFRLGAGAAGIQVNWLSMWPQLAAIYLAIVVLPPTALWMLWRRARRAS